MSKRVVFVAAAAVLLALFLGSVMVAQRSGFRFDSLGVTTQGIVTAAKIRQIQPGMSYAEVKAIIGSEGKIEGGAGESGDIMYGWPAEGEIGAHFNAIFQNDRLIQKVEFGVK